jgi:hypothetical protein
MPIVRASRLSYQLHTNRELGLMLAKKKPLAHFSDGAGAFPEAVQRYLRCFDRHVEAGVFVRRDAFCPPNAHRSYSLHRILFALPSEEWRIDEMIEMMESEVWGPEQERREGELLGYADWMNDQFLALNYPERTDR